MRALRSGRSGRSEIIFPNHNHIERPSEAIYIVIELPEAADSVLEFLSARK